MLKISSLLNEISKIQIGMHTPILNDTPILNEIFKTKIFIVSPTTTLVSKSKIFEIQIEIGTIAPLLKSMHALLLNEISKINIFEIHISIDTIPSSLNEISKIKTKIFEIHIEIGMITPLRNEISKIQIAVDA